MITMILSLLVISLSFSAHASLESCETVGQLKADPENCNNFYQCTNSGWAPLKCQAGLAFNEEISVCDYPKAGTTCATNTNTDTNSGNQSDESGLESCETVGQLKADPENCNNFYQCTNSGWAPLKCQAGLAFNEEISVCDYPKAGTTCGTNTNTDGNQGDESGQDSCDTVGQLKADSENCNNFYQCTNSGWVKLQCQAGLAFNEEISVCDYPKAGTTCGSDTNTNDDSHDDQSGDQGDQSNLEPCDTVGELKADAENCQKFYQCTNSGWENLKCASGLYFHSEISVCDWPKEGTKCGNDNDADDHSGDNDNTDDDNTDLKSCKKIGQVKSDTKHCDLYYQCTDCGWSLIQCESGLLFNPKTSVCDKAEKVTCAREGDLEPCDTIGEFKGHTKHCDIYYKCTKCGWALLTCDSGLLFDSKTATCGKSQAATCARDDDDDNSSKLEPCNNIGQLKADSEQCGHYYKCTKKGWGSLTCGSGLLFNSKTLACESADKVTCGSDDSNNDNSGDNDNDDAGSCDTVGQLKADSENCNNFYQCTNSGWVKLQCQAGLAFNEEISVCDYPKAGTTCGSDTNTNDDSHDDQSRGQDDQSDLGSCDVVGQLRADPENCNNFYQCTNSGWAQLKCQAGLAFNEEISVCDYPKAGTTCGTNTNTDTNSGSQGDQSGSQQDQSGMGSCDVVGQLRADPENCNNFYQCTNSGWAQLKCQAGLAFNEEISVCDYPKAGTTCGTNTNIDTNSGSQGDQSGSQQDQSGKALDSCEEIGELKADPEDCNKYYQCTTYGWQNMPCYGNLVFNADKLYCDYADNYQCEVTST